MVSPGFIIKCLLPCSEASITFERNCFQGTKRIIASFKYNDSLNAESGRASLNYEKHEGRFLYLKCLTLTISKSLSRLTFMKIAICKMYDLRYWLKHQSHLHEKSHVLIDTRQWLRYAVIIGGDRWHAFLLLKLTSNSSKALARNFKNITNVINIYHWYIWKYEIRNTKEIK